MEPGISRPMILQNRQSMVTKLRLKPTSHERRSEAYTFRTRVVQARLTPACDRRARNALKILLDVEHREAGAPRDQLAHGVGLTEAEFEDQQAACFQSPGRLIDEPPDDRQSVLPREEGDGRLMIAYFSLQCRAISLPHVRRMQAT